WEKLSGSEEKLDPSKEYYFRFEIEDADGYEWDLAMPYTVTVNGAVPDFISHPMNEGGLIDAYVRAPWNETDDIVLSVSTEFNNYVIQRGTSKKIRCVVDGSNDSVVWSVENGTSSLTSISADGTLTVGVNETANSLRVKCTSAVDSTVTFTTDGITVTDETVRIDSVKVEPASFKPTYPSLYVYFNSIVTGNDTAYGVWSMESTVTDESTHIDQMGALWIGSDEKAQEITVRATSVNDPSKYGEYTVPIGKISKITDPIYIEFNVSAAVFTTDMTGMEASERILSPEFELNGYFKAASDENGRGWYVDNGMSYTCLVSKNSNDNPGNWDRLSYSDDKLDSEKEYYIRIEIEDLRENGYEWDCDNLPDVYINGTKADLIAPPSNTTGLMDVFIKIELGKAPEAPKTFSVTFNTDGADPIPAQTVKEGEKAVKPADPVKKNLEFGGWWIGSEEFDFETPVTADVTVRARYITKAEVHVLGTSGRVYIASDKESAASDVVSEWYEYEGGFGSFGAIPSDGYVLSEWRTGSPDGEAVKSTDPGDPIHIDSDGRVCFSLEDGGYVFFAVFASADSVTTEQTEESETAEQGVTEPAGTKPAETSPEDEKDPEDLTETINKLKKMLIAAVICSGALIAAGIAVAVVFIVRKSKAKKSGK
ncbi:MAG: InlB B-repeat-containing protein, partial [Clostridia bacterium]|nr:InlB B-repeat-containing protein [Clostridia bacterium]